MTVQLLMDVAVVDHSPCRRHVAPAVTEQHRFELGVRHRLGTLPRHASVLRSPELTIHGACRHAKRAGDLTLAASEVLQPKQFTNLSHAQAFRHARAVTPPRGAGYGRISAP